MSHYHAGYAFPENHSMPVIAKTIRDIESNHFIPKEHIVPVDEVHEIDDTYTVIGIDSEWFHIAAYGFECVLSLKSERKDPYRSVNVFEDEYIQYCAGECEHGGECPATAGAKPSKGWVMLTEIIKALGYKEM